jgi:hypothetical protein
VQASVSVDNSALLSPEYRTKKRNEIMKMYGDEWKLRFPMFNGEIASNQDLWEIIEEALNHNAGLKYFDTTVYVRGFVTRAHQNQLRSPRPRKLRVAKPKAAASASAAASATINEPMAIEASQSAMPEMGNPPQSAMGPIAKGSLDSVFCEEQVSRIHDRAPLPPPSPKQPQKPLDKNLLALARTLGIDPKELTPERLEVYPRLDIMHKESVMLGWRRKANRLTCGGEKECLEAMEKAKDMIVYGFSLDGEECIGKARAQMQFLKEFAEAKKYYLGRDDVHAKALELAWGKMKAMFRSLWRESMRKEEGFQNHATSISETFLIELWKKDTGQAIEGATKAVTA